MPEADSDPGTHRLRLIARTNIILGIASLVRFVPELIMLLPKEGDYFVLAALDVAIALIWLKCGFALRRHALNALGFVAVGGTVIFAHSLTSSCFFGWLLQKNGFPYRADPDFFIVLAFLGSRFLLYGIEFLYWAWALFVLLLLAEDPTWRRSIRLAIVIAFFIAAAIQSVVFWVVFRL